MFPCSGATVKRDSANLFRVLPFDDVAFVELNAGNSTYVEASIGFPKQFRTFSSFRAHNP